MAIILMMLWCALLVVASLRVAGLFSPVSFIVLMLFLTNAIFLYVMVIMHTASPGLVMSHSYKFKSLYDREALSTVAIYTVLLSAVAFSGMIGCRQGARLRLRGRHQIVKSLQKVKLTISPRGVRLSAFGFLIAILAHAAVTQLKFLDPYQFYLQLRTAQFYDVTDPVSEAIIANVGSVGIVAAVFFAISLRNGDGISLLLLGIVVAYVEIYELASLSRWAALQAVVVIVLAIRERGLLARFVVAALAVMVVPIYLLVMFGRTSGLYGLGRLADIKFQALTGIFMINVLANLFGGGLVLATAMRHLPISYPLEYMMLSFSPLPSALDGFSNLLPYQVRINVYGPFSAVSELYWFGGWASAVAFLIIAFSMYRTQRIWVIASANGNPRYLVAAFLCFGLTIYGHLLFNQYPLRNSIRWIELAIIFSYFPAAFSRIRFGSKARGSSDLQLPQS